MAGSSASKNVFCANSGAYPYTMNVSWSESSTNVANNTSVISASGSMGGQKIAFDAGAGYAYYLKLYWHDNRTNSDTHFATSGAFSTMGMGYGSRYVSDSITVTHKDDGSLSGYVWMRFESPSTSGGWAPGTTDLATADTVLTTIARASSFTIKAGSALLGSPVSIAIDRKSSSFTHKVAYTFSGSSSTTVSTNAATSASFTPPISLASRVPNSTTGSLTVTVTTMNGGTQIGSPVSKSVNLGVPTSVVPTMGTPTATRVNNGVPSSWGVYVKTFSKCTVKIVSAAGAYGSTIKSYSITGGGLNATTSSATTGVLNTAGTVTFTCKITDSRGRTATKTVSITVVDYSGPSLSVSANRCNSSGVATAEGTYLRVTVNYSFSSVSGKNSIASKSVTCNGVSNTTFGDNSPFTLAANCSIGKTYVLTAKVTDALGKSYSASIDIRTASRILNVRKTKDGLAIGKFSEKAAFEVAWDAYFGKSVNANVVSASEVKGTELTANKASFYSAIISGANGKREWIKLGSISNTNSAYNTIINVYSGNGYNGESRQNGWAKIFIKDGYQSTPSTTRAYGVTVELQGMAMDNFKAKILATASNACDVWVYMPWGYWDGHYTVEYIESAKWTHSGSHQEAEPTGVEQQIKYLYSFFPIGAVYISVTPTNPSTYFGGTWVQFGQGKTLVGVNTSDTDFNTVEKTGGSKRRPLAARIGAFDSDIGKIGYAAMANPSGGGFTYGIAGSSFRDISGSRVNHNTIVVDNVDGKDPSIVQPYITVYFWKRTA